MTQSKPRQPVVPGSTGTYAVLPLRDIVVFPHMIVPLFVGREKSIRALEEVVKGDRHILLATQINATDDDPATDAIYKVGTLASVLQLLKLPDGTVKVLVEGASRAQVKDYTRTDEFYEAEAEALPEVARRPGRGRGAGPLGRLRVRELREAQQEGFARGRRPRSPRSTSPRSSPTRSPRISPSRSPTSRRSLRSRPSPNAWRRCSA